MIVIVAVVTVMNMIWSSKVVVHVSIGSVVGLLRDVH